MGREYVEIPHYPHQGRHLRHRCQKRHCHVTMWTEYAAEPGDDSMSHTTDLLSRNGSMSMLSKQDGTITSTSTYMDSEQRTTTLCTTFVALLWAGDLS